MTKDQVQKIIDYFISWNEEFEKTGEEFYEDTGMLRPGKSQPAACCGSPSDEEREKKFKEWVKIRRPKIHTRIGDVLEKIQENHKKTSPDLHDFGVSIIPLIELWTIPFGNKSLQQIVEESGFKKVPVSADPDGSNVYFDYILKPPEARALFEFLNKILMTTKTPQNEIIKYINSNANCSSCEKKIFSTEELEIFNEESFCLTCYKELGEL